MVNDDKWWSSLRSVYFHRVIPTLAKFDVIRFVEFNDIHCHHLHKSTIKWIVPVFIFVSPYDLNMADGSVNMLKFRRNLHNSLLICGIYFSHVVQHDLDCDTDHNRYFRFCYMCFVRQWKQRRGKVVGCLFFRLEWMNSMRNEWNLRLARIHHQLNKINIHWDMLQNIWHMLNAIFTRLSFCTIHFKMNDKFILCKFRQSLTHQQK